MILESFRATRAAIIYNPVARSLSRNIHLLERAVAGLAREGIEAHLVATTAPQCRLSNAPRNRGRLRSHYCRRRMEPSTK